jgi:hypothetical protein
MRSVKAMIKYAEIVIHNAVDDGYRRNARMLCETAIRDFSSMPQHDLDVRRAAELLRLL